MLELKLIAACFALIGLVSLGVSVVLYRKARQTGNWPTTQGKILSAEIVERIDDENGKSYQTKILYNYSVNDTTFTADVLWPGFSTRNYDIGFALQIRDRYPAGSAVPIFFNPEKPDEAVLACRKWERWPLWLGLIFIAAGSFFWLMALHSTMGSTDVDWW